MFKKGIVMILVAGSIFVMGCNNTEEKKETVKEEQQAETIKAEKTNEERIEECLGDTLIEKVEKSEHENSDNKKMTTYVLKIKYEGQSEKEIKKQTKEMVAKIKNKCSDIEYDELLFSYDVVVDGVEFKSPTKYFATYENDDVVITESFCSIDGVEEYDKSKIKEQVKNKEKNESNDDCKVWANDTKVYGFLYGDNKLYSNYVHQSVDCKIVKSHLKDSDLTPFEDNLSVTKEKYPDAGICPICGSNQFSNAKLREIGIK